MTEQCKEACIFTLVKDDVEDFVGHLYCTFDKNHDGNHAYHHSTFTRLKPHEVRP